MGSNINFNGVNYNSVDDMPPDVRRQYEAALSAFADANQNGTPDILDAANIKPIIKANTAIFFNGQVHPSIEALPPEARAKYQQFQAQFDTNQNGIPDIMEQMLTGLTVAPGPNAAPAADPQAPAFAPSAPIAPTATPSGPRLMPMNGPSVVSPEGGGFTRPLIIIALAGTAVLLCAFATLGVLFFMK
jgi:hypothetical protein